ncbi:hypothetical protein GCM10023189_57790 [Nibrella saemangeumensis]|uniref:L,D-TPase catalytic domain-containing protein n=1 Tax=Nibrella saemangeumensis TaxID=1084526 RepID=A0ABP8NR34_9BACT
MALVFSSVCRTLSAWFLVGALTTCTCVNSVAQVDIDADNTLTRQAYEDLLRYASSVGIQASDRTALHPERHTLALLHELAYGRSVRLSYQGVREVIDSSRIKLAYTRLLAGEDAQSVAVALEPGDNRYCTLVESYRYVLDETETGKLLSVRERRERLATTLNTYRWLNRFPNTDKILITIPAAQLLAQTTQGVDVLSMRVILGKPATPTPTLASTLTGVVIYPYWYVPKSIATKELLPKIRKNPAAVLEQMRMQVLNAKGQVLNPEQIDWKALGPGNFPYVLRQSTGCDNALGILKFAFHSPFDVYLHDTNQRELFETTRRYLSHGCIRVEKPLELANWLLRDRQLTNAQLSCKVERQKPTTLPVRAGVAVFVMYHLVDADADGCLTWYDNVYGRTL